MSALLEAVAPKSDQLNADDLIAGSITITVSAVEVKPRTDQPIKVFYNGDNGKPYKPCKTMARVMINAWGSDENLWVGRRVTLYRDPDVQWAGRREGGIRISALSHISGPIETVVTIKRGVRQPFSIEPIFERAESAEDQARTLMRNIKDKIDTATDVDAVLAGAKLSEKLEMLRTQFPDMAAEIDHAAHLRRSYLAQMSNEMTQEGTEHGTVSGN